MIRTIILNLLLITSITVLCQTEINYQPKSLKKKLNTYDITNISELKELKINTELINGKFFLIGNTVSQIKYIYIGRVNSCRTGGCSPSNVKSTNGNSEYFDYFALFDRKGFLQYIQVYSYKATYGSEITSKGWLKQFYKIKDSAEFEVGKNIDSISGATISVNGITVDLNDKTRILKKKILRK